jgi:hypothetical protein
VERPARAQAVKVERCDNAAHVLPAGDKDTDLEVTNGITCMVDGSAPQGTYLYRNVNIWNGTLSFRDAKIDFHAHSILAENGGTLEAGFNAAKVTVDYWRNVYSLNYKVPWSTVLFQQLV